MSEIERPSRRANGKRWTTAHAREFVQGWRASGLSATAYAAQHKISASRLSYWSKQLDLEADQAPQFAAVAIPTQAVAVHAIEIEVSGLTVRVPEGVDAGFVAQLVSALQQRSDAPC